VDCLTATCQLAIPDMAHLLGYVTSNAAHARRMVRAGSHSGRSVTICGAGPSLARHVRRLPATTHVWACNSALLYLIRRGARVTHGFAIDSSEGMLTDWAATFDVNYLVASSIAPRLRDHLLAAGRRLTWFHSYLGVPDPEGWAPPDADTSYELDLYRRLYPASVRVGYGLNAVPRAICLALIMGFADIRVYGADCAAAPDAPPMPTYWSLGGAGASPEYRAWMRALVMYADGRTAADAFGESAYLAEATIDGVRWATRADMTVSARHLVDLQRAHSGRVTLVGDTLPAALARQSDAFMRESFPDMGGLGRVVNFAPELVAA